jgi:hypothetical protein
MKRTAMLLPLLLLTACGPQAPQSSSHPGAAAAPAASPAPGAATRAPEPLLVVLESSGGVGKPQDTIAIAGLDGYARAKTRFKPHATPWVLPDLGPLTPRLAHVANGRAYFVDGDGVVRSLGVDGGVREETRFPVTSPQQEVSFAVSPDGHDLVGAVVTLPAKPNPEPTPGWFPSTPYAMDVMTATSGGPATVAYHRTWLYDEHLGSGAQFVGWDTAGPVATWPSSLGTQGGGPHQWNGTALLHYPGGRPGPAVPAPDGCFVMDHLPSGVSLCGGTSGGVQVLGADGSVQWSVGAASEQGLYGFLSPDAQRLVILGSGSQVFGRSGAPVTLPNGFYHAGWIDAKTIAGQVDPPGNFAYVSLTNPGKVVDLGFKGEFVGGFTG